MLATRNETHITISIPFKANQQYKVARVIPFPSVVESKLVKVDLEPTVIFNSPDGGKLSFMSLDDFHDRCIQYKVMQMVCPINLIPKFATPALPCLSSIARFAKDVIKHCQFKTVPTGSVYYLHVPGKHVVFFPHEVPLQVRCPGESVIQTAERMVEIKDVCSFSSSLLSMDEMASASTTFSFKDDTMIFPDVQSNVSLKSLNITDSKLEIESIVAEMNQTTFPLFNQWYHAPYYAYTTMSFMSVVICSIILIALYCFLKYLYITRCRGPAAGDDANVPHNPHPAT